MNEYFSILMQDQPVKTNADVYAVLESRITSGEWPVGTTLPWEADLAAELGCKRYAVSQAIGRLIHEGMAERRKRAGTRVLRTTKKSDQPKMDLDAFAFIYPSEKHEGIWRTVCGFQEAATEAGRRTIALTTSTDYKKEAELVGRLTEFDIKGAVIYSIIENPEAQVHVSQNLIRAKVPVVLACTNLPGLNIPAVFYDDFHGAYTMTNYLIKQGLTEIGFFSSSRSPESYHGYEWALTEAGMEVCEGNVMMGTSFQADYNDALREPREVARTYLSGRPGLQGVVCGYDFLALGIMQAAEELGIRVPKDLKVTGIDDYALAASASVPLTTYRVPYEEIGRSAFALLNRRITNQPIYALEERLRGNIVIRKSA